MGMVILTVLPGCGGAPAPSSRLARMAGTDRSAPRATDPREGAIEAVMVQPADSKRVSEPAMMPTASSDGAGHANLASASDENEWGAGSASPVSPASPALATASNAAAPARGGRWYTVDAMVGQVNGESVYASEVLNPIDGQLRALSQSVRPREFVEQASRLVRGQLDQVVLDRLILAEAEAQLSLDEQARLRMIMADIRAELVRKHGQGSAELADGVLQEKTGFGLDQTLRRERQKLLIGTYQQRHVMPKIDVSRADIEREYESNLEMYRPHPARTVRMIVVADAETAGAVEQALNDGQSFAEVAADDTVNTYKPSDAGLFAEGLTDTEVFGEAQLNEAVASLGAGEFAGPMTLGDNRQAWLCVETIERREARSLQDAQMEIEQRLRQRQLQLLTMQERRRLMAEGSYDPIGRMASEVMEILRDRYLAAR